MATFLSEFVDGGPTCSRDDCMIQDQGGTSTMAYFPPIYNNNNVNINPDMNTQTYNRRCLACGKAWTETWQNGSKIS